MLHNAQPAHLPHGGPHEIRDIALRIIAAAAYIGVSKAHLYVLINRNELAKIKLGGRAAGVKRSDLDAWVNRCADADQSGRQEVEVPA